VAVGGGLQVQLAAGIEADIASLCARAADLRALQGHVCAAAELNGAAALNGRDLCLAVLGVQALVIQLHAGTEVDVAAIRTGRGAHRQ